MTKEKESYDKEIAEIKVEVEKNISLIQSNAVSLENAVYPYILLNDQIDDMFAESSDLLRSLHFSRLSSCTTENVEDLAAYLQDKMTRLFTAIYSTNVLVAYGIVSYAGRTDLVIGLSDSNGEAITKSILMGLLTGIEIEPYSIDLIHNDHPATNGGIISAVPVCKTDDPQRFDISSLMRSLNGQNYSLFVIARPCLPSNVQNKYGKAVEIRDDCYAMSKRSISRQASYSDGHSASWGNSSTRKGILQEVITQIKNKKVSIPDIIDSLVNGGVNSGNSNESTTENTTVGGSVAYDVQNGMALELIEYCDKAIERLRQGMNIGMWNTSIVYLTDLELTEKILKASLLGELSKAVTDNLPPRAWSFGIGKKDGIKIPSGYIDNCENNSLCVPITSAELGMICTPPFGVVPDFELRQGKLYPMVGSSSNGVVIGNVSDGQRPLPSMNFALSEADLNKHTFICGITGSGKTTTVKEILKNCSKPFMVIESAKKEYRNIDLPKDRKPEVYTLGKPEMNCLQFNPFYIQYGINLQTHIDFLKDLFNASFSFYGPMPYILEKCLNNIYKKYGWNLTLGYHPYLVDLENTVEPFDSKYMKAKYNMATHKYIFPTMQDLMSEVKRYIEEEMQYDSEVGGNIKTAMLARLESLCVGSKGFMLNTNEPFNTDQLMQHNVVFEMEGLADDSDKAFCVGLLVIFINEYRQVYKEERPTEKLGLQHLLVIEEAHRLLKNVDTEKSSENMGDPKGKAVEHFTNMIAEMRSYGQGVIIAEQIPSKLAPDVIKNSSNKIIQRIVSADDQAIIANTIGVKEEDAVYLGNLKTGFALCHKEGMSLPVFVKVNPVDDNYVSDAALFSKKSREVYNAINHNIIREVVVEKLNDYGLRILNTLLIENESVVVQAIGTCKDQIDGELTKADTSLLSCIKPKDLYGFVLTESLITYLLSGIYSIKHLMNDNLYNNIIAMLNNPTITKVKAVKEGLTSEYGEDCRNRGLKCVIALIQDNLTDQVDVSLTARQYFFDNVSNETIEQINKVVHK